MRVAAGKPAKQPTNNLVLNRKLTGGVGLGAAITTLLVAVVRGVTAYDPNPEEIVAVQTLISFGLGWWIQEETKPEAKAA